MLAAVLLLGGCGVPTMGDLPLPGGAANGAAYRVTIEFADVLDLVPYSTVKVNDVTVGQVEDIGLAGWTARVRVRVDAKVRLPDNATAAIRQTSLLGEKFISLAEPVGEPAAGSLSDGDVIPLSRTKRAAEVEEVLGALGLLLNGGGLTNVRTITHELSTALDGNEAAAKGVLRQLEAFLAGLSAQRDDIARAIDALDRLLEKVAAQRDTVANALKALGPGLEVLAEQRSRLTQALVALSELSAVGTRVVNATRDELLTVLRSLQPTLDQLARAGDNLPKALDSLFTIVYPPNVTQAIRNGHINLDVAATFDHGRTRPTALVVDNPGVTPRRGTVSSVLEGGLRG